MMRAHSLQDYLNIKRAVSPRFSPDGKRLAYLSNLSGTFQIYLLNLENDEQQQLTSYEDSIEFVEFSPVREELIFGLSQGGNENTQLYLFDLAQKSVRALTQKEGVRYNWGGWSYDGNQIAYTSNERTGKDFDVYTYDLTSGTVKCAFKEGGWCESYGFSPLGTYLAVRVEHTNYNHDAYLINVASGEQQHITPHAGNAQYLSLRWLPDEQGFYIRHNQDRDFMSLFYYNFEEKKYEARFTPDWDVESVVVSRDGAHVTVLVNEEGYTRLHVFTHTGWKELKLPSIPAGFFSELRYSPDGSLLAFVMESPLQPGDLWLIDFGENELVSLTKSPCPVERTSFVPPQLVRYASFDGQSIPVFMYVPSGVRGKVPVIVSIHGGPEDQYRPIFSGLVQYFIANGYAVLCPNVRGSSGYGKHYQALDDVRKRMDSVKDLAALSDVIESHALLDKNRVALMGGSYGGFMVLAGLAFYPQKWAAGVDIVGISNFVTFLENTAPYRRTQREAEYGSLKEDRAFLESISPIHSVDKIRAPLVVIHGANDPRVPLGEAQQIAARLKEQGKEVLLLVYADEGHGLAKLKNRLDAYPKVVSFLDRVLKPPRS